MSNTDNNNMAEIALQTIALACQLPIVKVSRDNFLREEFKNSKHLDVILKDGPQAVYTIKALRLRATRLVDSCTKKTALASFIAGLPANPVIAVPTTTIDVVQNMAFALNLAQKIAYLFGEDDLFREDHVSLSEEMQYRIVGYLGIMMGASGAGSLVMKTSLNVGRHLGNKVMRQALTKTLWYPLFKKVASSIGVKITKKSVGSLVAKTVPILGGVISGVVTYAAFKPMGNKLADSFVKMYEGEFTDGYDELSPDFIEILDQDEVIEGEFEECNSDVIL